MVYFSWNWASENRIIQILVFDWPSCISHLNTGQICPLFRWLLNTGPFDFRTLFAHLNTELVRNSDVQCIRYEEVQNSDLAGNTKTDHLWGWLKLGLDCWWMTRKFWSYVQPFASRHSRMSRDPPSRSRCLSSPSLRVWTGPWLGHATLQLKQNKTGYD